MRRSVGDRICQLRLDCLNQNRTPTHIVIGRETYESLREEFYKINGEVLPPPNSGRGCELMGMLFSFINYDNYLSVR